MTSQRLGRRMVPVVFGMLLLGSVDGMGGMPVAQAQIGQERSQYEREPVRPGQGGRGHQLGRRPTGQTGSPGGDLPSWAAPGNAGPKRGLPDGTIQTRNPGGGGPPGGDDNPQRNVPLGGLEWLLLAGLGYGLFRLRDDE